jgi:hypothetical protein
MLRSCRGVVQLGPDPSLRLPPLAGSVGSGSRGPASACASLFRRWCGVGQPGAWPQPLPPLCQAGEVGWGQGIGGVGHGRARAFWEGAAD